MYIHGACNLGHGNVNSSDAVLTHSSKVVNWSKDQLLPRPDRARISGPEGPEILVYTNCNKIHLSYAWIKSNVEIFIKLALGLINSSFLWTQEYKIEPIVNAATM